MKKITNPGLLKRNKLIGKYGTLASFLVLAGGIAISNFLPDRFDLSYLALILGSILVLVGSSFTSRWGRIPPPDEAVDDVLKGLDERYTIVHYRLGAEHANRNAPTRRSAWGMRISRSTRTGAPNVSGSSINPNA